MDEDNNELLYKLLKFYDEQATRPRAHTFLEVIGRSRDENLTSRLLAFILKNNDDLCISLLEYYADQKNKVFPIQNLENKTVTVEKAMANGRADIFVEANGYTLTIENKIYSWENNDQTNVYQKFVSVNYKGSYNAFIYLKPDYNRSIPKNGDFAQMTYSELLNKLEKFARPDKFEDDFRQHIQNNLTKYSGDLMETDLIILKHYKEFKQMFDDAERKFSDLRDEIQNYLIGEFGCTPIKDYRIDKPAGTLVADLDKRWKRISKNTWQNLDAPDDKDKFYFYVEADIDSPQRITAQMTVKYFGDPNNSRVYKFMECEENKLLLPGKWYKTYYISSPRGEFKSDYDIMCEQWRQDLMKYMKDTFEEYLKSMDVLVSKFYSSPFMYISPAHRCPQ